MNDNTSGTEAGKLFCELHNHFLLTKTLKDPVQVTLNQKEILILHRKWNDAGDIFNISLAILLTDYSAKMYDMIRENLYGLIESYSETHTCSISTLTANYPLSDKHPLHSEISTGTIIWQRPDSN